MRKLNVIVVDGIIYFTAKRYAKVGMSYVVDDKIQRCPSPIAAAYWGHKYPEVVASNGLKGHRIPQSFVDEYNKSTTNKIKYVLVKYTMDEPEIVKGFIKYKLIP